MLNSFFNKFYTLLFSNQLNTLSTIIVSFRFHFLYLSFFMNNLIIMKMLII